MNLKNQTMSANCVQVQISTGVVHSQKNVQVTLLIDVVITGVVVGVVLTVQVILLYPIIQLSGLYLQQFLLLYKIMLA